MTSSVTVAKGTKTMKQNIIDKARKKNITVTIPYIADIDLVSKLGNSIVYEYQTIPRSLR